YRFASCSKRYLKNSSCLSVAISFGQNVNTAQATSAELRLYQRRRLRDEAEVTGIGWSHSDKLLDRKSASANDVNGRGRRPRVCRAPQSTNERAPAHRLGGWLKRLEDGPPNGSDVKLRGQGPRGYGSAARRMPACESRDAGGVTPRSSR